MAKLKIFKYNMNYDMLLLPAFLFMQISLFAVLAVKTVKQHIKTATKYYGENLKISIKNNKKSERNFSLILIFF